MITQKHIDNAKLNETLVKHVLAPSGMAKSGEITINGSAVIIYLDSETSELIAHELVAPQDNESVDYSMFSQSLVLELKQ